MDKYLEFSIDVLSEFSALILANNLAITSGNPELIIANHFTAQEQLIELKKQFNEMTLADESISALADSLGVSVNE